VILAVTSKKNWVIGALVLEGNPYDGHMKREHHLECYRLKGTVSNTINPTMSAAAMNFGKLLRLVVFDSNLERWRQRYFPGQNAIP